MKYYIFMFLGAVFWGSVFLIFQRLFYNPYGFTVGWSLFLSMFMSFGLAIAAASQFSIKNKKFKYLHVFMFPGYGMMIGVFIRIIYNIMGLYF